MGRLSAAMMTLMLAVSCASWETGRRMDVAECVMNERPDSALAVLEGLDRGTLAFRRGRARFSLLYSMALDKNYLDVCSDSIIRPAVEYYEDHGAASDRLRAFYYLGRIYYNAGDYARAMIAYEKASAHLDGTDDPFMAGLLHREMSSTYDRVYNHAEALEYARLAYEEFIAAGKMTHASYSRLSIANIYSNMREYGSAVDIYSEIWKERASEEDVCLVANAGEGYLLALSESFDGGTDDTAPAMTAYLTDTLGVSLGAASEAVMALNAAGEDRREEAEELLARAWSRCRGTGDEMLVGLYEYKVLRALGDHEAALGVVERTFQQQDSVSRMRLEQAVMTEQKKYYQKEMAYNALVSEVRLAVTVLLLGAALLSVALLCRFAWRKIKVREEKIAQVVGQLEEVRAQASASEKVMGAFASRIQALYRTRYSYINSICEEYYSYSGSTRNRHVMQKVDAMVGSLADDSEYDTLVEIVNEYNGRVMDRINVHFPDMKQNDRKLLCYWYAGFSTQAMSLFLDMNVKNVYTRKSRLKAVLRKADAENGTGFLDHLV